jgi:predicted negative regulator of RcsB-dependent stress response
MARSDQEKELGDRFWKRVEKLQESGNYRKAADLLAAQFTRVPRRHAPRIAMRVAELCVEMNSVDEARHWYTEVLTSEDPELAGDAGCMLGALYEKNGQLSEAADAYQEATRFRGEGSAYAALALSNIRLTQGQLDAARAALRFAAASGVDEVAVTALYQLAQMIAEADNTWGAEILLKRVLQSGHAPGAVHAAYNLGLLYAERAEWARAKETLTIATGADDAEFAAASRLRLGDVLVELGETVEATEMYRATTQSRIAGVWEEAAASLAVLLLGKDPLAAEAEEILQALGKSEEAQWRAWAEDRRSELRTKNAGGSAPGGASTS